jgi:FAD/FMN-containing dehydrogenase
MAMTGTTLGKPLSEATIEELRAKLRGQLISRTDDGYEAARKVYNGMIDRHPFLIARCVDVADVIGAVDFARENGLTLAIRGGGHNVAGFGTCDDGLVIDLSPMKGIHVDPAKRTVRAEGGCTWGDVDHATHAFGLAAPGGVISTTGIAGLTLGGGIGYLTRKYGLSCDNLISADVVTADGRLITASADQNADLFWGLRGGGGNFGVVTSFLFRLHPVKTVQAGPTFWPLEQAPQVMKAYREFIRKAPENVTGFMAFLTVPPVPLFPAAIHNRKVCAIIWCSTGSLDQFEAATKGLRAVGEPLLDHVGPMPFTALQTLFDPLLPPGLQWYWRADFLNDLTDQAIPKHVEHAGKAPAGLSQVHVYPINGAAHRVGAGDTAFAYRDAMFALVIVGVDPSPANAKTITQWCKDYFDAVHAYSAGGAYVNFMMEEGQERVQAAFRDNYARLAAVKKKYDPTNFFRVNQNIRPA